MATIPADFTYDELLQKVYRTVDVISNLEGQDQQYVIEMSQAMINDIIETADLKPIREYVSHYCDVYDNDEMLDEIVADI